MEALKTDKGSTRENNEDRVDSAINSHGDKMYILCDGMGGYNGGEVASLECSKCFKDKFERTSFNSVQDAKNWLYETAILANNKIMKMANKNEKLEKMGTTLVCLIIGVNFKVYASVGDSRIYTYNHKELVQLSEDQTFANALLKAGYINEKEASIHPKKNVLLCAIGSNEDDLDVEIKEIEGRNNFLICSDGLYNMVNSKEILKIINTNEEINVKADNLINKALDNGGKDNVSVILVEDCL